MQDSAPYPASFETQAGSVGDSGRSWPGAGAQGGGPEGLTPVQWALRCAGLLAISVISGLLWLALVPVSSEQSPQAQPLTKFPFRLELREEGRQGCKDVSTKNIAVFFSSHQCEHLTRALYTTTLPSGERVLTSVVAVRMADPASAQQLNRMVTMDDTGNVKDLVSDGRAPKGFPSLKNDYGYASEQQDRLVVVGESAYFGKSVNDQQQLVEVTREALRLGRPQDEGAS